MFQKTGSFPAFWRLPDNYRVLKPAKNTANIFFGAKQMGIIDSIGRKTVYFCDDKYTVSNVGYMGMKKYRRIS
jgi:hypothetical protein